MTPEAVTPGAQAPGAGSRAAQAPGTGAVAVPGGRLFAAPATTATWPGDGSVILRSKIPLGRHADNMAQLFRAAADASPDRVLVAQRQADSGRTLTYGLAREKVDGLAQALLDEAGPGTSAGRPVLILSGNSIEHLLLTLACYTIGTPVAPVSTAYSLLAADYAKLHAMAGLADPAVVFADNGDAYAGALAAVSPGRAVVTCAGPAASGHLGYFDFDELAATAPTAGRISSPRCTPRALDRRSSTRLPNQPTGQPAGGPHAQAGTYESRATPMRDEQP